MLLFLLFVFSIFFVLIMGVGMSILAGMCFLFGLACLSFVLLSFSLFIPSFSIAIGCAILALMLFMFSKHKTEDVSKYYLIIACLCVGYVVFQVVTPLGNQMYFDEIIIKNNDIINITHTDSKNVFVMIGLLISSTVFYLLFNKKSKENNMHDEDK